jgi:signal transduction histidine kinase
MSDSESTTEPDIRAGTPAPRPGGSPSHRHFDPEHRLEEHRLGMRRPEGRRFRSLRGAAQLPHSSMLQDGTSLVGGEESDEAMEAVARLAGKVAHHLNNLLTVVGGCMAHVESELGDDSLEAEFTDIRHACTRAKELSSQLLSISGNRWMDPRVLDLRTLVLELDLAGLFAPDVIVAMDFEATPCPVLVDPTYMSQVVTGLARNAHEALGDEGVVTVRIDHLPGRTIDGRAATGWISLEVTDTGPGMDPETLKRVLHPFYGTHPFTEDRGVGLSAAYGIVRQFGGTLKLSSALGQGTTVRVWLPASPPVSMTQPRPEGSGGAPSGNGGTPSGNGGRPAGHGGAPSGKGDRTAPS